MNDMKVPTELACHPRFLEGLCVAGLVEKYSDKNLEITEYFSGSGYVTTWLATLANVTAVDVVDVNESLLREQKITYRKADALEDIRTLMAQNFIVAHAGLHHLGEHTPADRDAIQREFVTKSIQCISNGGAFLLIDVPGIPILNVGGKPSIISIARNRLSLSSWEQGNCLIERIGGDSICSQDARLTFDLSKLSRQVRSGGNEIVNSRRILELFVDQYRTGGHRGGYPSIELYRQWTENAGGKVAEEGYLFTPWIFGSWDQLAEFVVEFLKLDRWNHHSSVLRDTWEREGWARIVGKNAIIVPWWLQYVVAVSKGKDDVNSTHSAIG